jgi:CheY-like chemotaxis protein
MTLPKLWIVDDGPLATFYIDRLIKIRSLPFETTIYNDPGACLEALQAYRLHPDQLPDVILLDIEMPIVNGWIFLENFNTLRNCFRKEIIIYLMSSSTDPRDLARANQLSLVKDYIIKPILVEKLQAIHQLVVRS